MYEEILDIRGYGFACFRFDSSLEEIGRSERAAWFEKAHPSLRTVVWAGRWEGEWPHIAQTLWRVLNRFPDLREHFQAKLHELDALAVADQAKADAAATAFREEVRARCSAREDWVPSYLENAR